MSIQKDKKSGVYYYSFRTAEGKTRRITTRCTNIDEAKTVVKEANLDRLALAAKAGRLSQEAIALITTGSKLTVTDAIDQWAVWKESIGQSAGTIVNELTYLQAWMRETKCADLPPASITEKHIDAYVNDDGPAFASSRCTRLSAIRSFFAYCSAKGWCAGDPSKLVRVKMRNLSHAQKEKRPRNVFSDEEVEALLETALDDPFWFFAVSFGRDTGLRLGDIAQIEWDCFVKPGSVSVWTDKRDRRVQLPMTSRMTKALAKLEPINKRYLFPDQAVCARDPRLRAKLSVQFARLCGKAGIEGEGKSFHSLRHTYVTACAKAGIPIEHISQNVGHASISMTRQYIRP